MHRTPGGVVDIWKPWQGEGWRRKFCIFTLIFLDLFTRKLYYFENLWSLRRHLLKEDLMAL
jgi:hypothetical protein